MICLYITNILIYCIIYVFTSLAFPIFNPLFDSRLERRELRITNCFQSLGAEVAADLYSLGQDPLVMTNSSRT